MGLMVSYMVQSAFVMTCLYLCYKWLMASNTFHAANRAALLAIYAAAWCLPALLPMFVSAGASEAMAVAIDGIVAIPGLANAEDAAVSVSVYRSLLWVYIAGVSVMIMRCVFGLAHMWRIIRRGTATRRDGHTIVVNAEAPGPFSWMNYVVVRPDDCDDDLDLVINHERAHIHLWHCIDLIISQLSLALQWFSPAAWLMDRELRNVHEYQVDNKVSPTAPYRYQMMLIKKTVGSSFPTFADSLNHSQLKNRLTMMISKESKPAHRAAYLALPAAAALALAALGVPAVASVTDSLGKASISSRVPDSKVSDEHAIKSNKPEDAAAEKIAEYKGGVGQLMKDLAQSISYPKDAPADMTDVRVIVQFTVETDGTLSDMKILRGSDFAPFNEEALKAVMSTSGNWIPAYRDGQPLPTKFTLPVQFKAE